VLARELAARGVDLIDCSSGGIRAENSMIDYAKRRHPLRRNYQVPYAEAIRRETGVATMAVGAILDGAQAEAILQQGQADLVAIAREALVDPHWALHAAQALGVDPGVDAVAARVWLVARVAPARRYRRLSNSGVWARLASQIALFLSGCAGAARAAHGPGLLGFSAAWRHGSAPLTLPSAISPFTAAVARRAGSP